MSQIVRFLLFRFGSAIAIRQRIGLNNFARRNGHGWQLKIEDGISCASPDSDQCVAACVTEVHWKHYIGLLHTPQCPKVT